jgi:hypothetical protein
MSLQSYDTKISLLHAFVVKDSSPGKLHPSMLPKHYIDTNKKQVDSPRPPANLKPRGLQVA